LAMCLDIEIAPLEKADIAAVVEIERTSQPEPWSAESFAQELGRLHSRVLAARLGSAAPGRGDNGRAGARPGQIVGYLCYWCVAGEIQILNVAVHESFRRLGVGRALLSHAIHFGCDRKAHLVSLEVRKSNVPARRLYEDMGFKVVGERPDYYGVQTEPAVLMELEVGAERG
jgi:[ribosomal protein S18]-alanine N-acetyltransferase